MELFPLDTLDIRDRYSYAPTADGQRFMVLTPVGGTGPRPFHWSTSFEGELRKKRRDETMSRRGYILKSPCQDVLDFLRHHAPTSQAEHAILDYKYVTKAP